MRYIFLILFIISCKANTFFYIDKYSREYKVDPRIVKALIDIESTGIVKAHSKKNAYGLMQVTKIAALEYYKERIKITGNDKYKWFDMAPDSFWVRYLKTEKVNIRIGTWYLSYCLKRSKGNYLLALNYYIYGNEEKTAWNYLYRIIDNAFNFKTFEKAK